MNRHLFSRRRADAVANFLVNVFQVPYQSCYGTNADKDKLTHLRWSKLPIEPLEIEVIRKAVSAKDETLMTGREVMVVHTGTFVQGEKNYFLNTETLEAGAYQLVLTTNNYRIAQPLMVR